MDNIILNGGGIVAKTLDGRNGLPSDARLSVQYYKDITSIPYPYLYCLIIVREDDPEDTLHPQGIYVITKLNRLGNVDSSGIVPLKEFTEALLKQELQLTDEEKENVISNIFDKTSSSGLKRKYLKQKATLTQNDFNNSDTIYVIRYDFDLQNLTITIPENCTLQFDGGSLSNGTIVGQHDTIVANYKIFSNVNVTGDWNCNGNIQWWVSGCEWTNVADNDQPINNDEHVELLQALNSSFVTLLFPPRAYYTSVTLNLNVSKHLILCGKDWTNTLSYPHYGRPKNRTVIYTDRDITLLRIKPIAKGHANAYGVATVSIEGGIFDVSRYQELTNNTYSKNVVEIIGGNGSCINGLHLNTTILGFRDTNFPFSGTGVYITASASELAKGYTTNVNIESYIAHFEKGVVVENSSSAASEDVWMTDVNIGGYISYCKQAIITDANGKITSIVQSAKIANSEEETKLYPLVVLNGEFYKVDGMFWDLGGLNNYYGLYISENTKSVSISGETELLKRNNYKQIDGKISAITDYRLFKGGNPYSYEMSAFESSPFADYFINFTKTNGTVEVKHYSSNGTEKIGSASIENVDNMFAYEDNYATINLHDTIENDDYVDIIITLPEHPAAHTSELFIKNVNRQNVIESSKLLYTSTNTEYNMTVDGILNEGIDSTKVSYFVETRASAVSITYRLFGVKLSTIDIYQAKCFNYRYSKGLSILKNVDKAVLSASSLGMKEGSEYAFENEQIFRTFLNKKISYLYVDKFYYIRGGDYFDVDFELHLVGNGGFNITSGGYFLRPLAGSKIIIDGLTFENKNGNIISTGDSSSAINYLIEGIEITNCTFNNCSKVITIYGADVDYSVTKFGIKKLTVERCNFLVNSSQFFLQNIVFEDGMYFRENKVKGTIYSFVSAAANNEYQYATTNAVNYNGEWIFDGNIISDSICESTSYHTMLVAECKKLILKNNTMNNIIGVGDGVTYDAYGSAAEYIIENNTYRNICQLPRSGSLYQTTSEIFKSKGNAAKRHIFNNSWYTDFDECREILASEGITFTDSQFNNIAYLTIFAYTSNFEELKFIGNTITLKGGGIKANTANNGKITHSLLSNNTFAIDKVFSANGATLLPSWGLQEAGDVVVTNNIFDFNNQNLPNANTIGIIGTSSYPNTVHPASPNLSVTVTDNKVSGNVSISCDHELKSANIKNNIRIGANVNMSTYTKGATGTVGEFSYIENEQYIENNKTQDTNPRTIRIDSIDNKNCIYNIKATNNAQLIFSLIPLYANPSKSIDILINGEFFSEAYNISKNENNITLIDKDSNVVSDNISGSLKLYEDSDTSIVLSANSTQCNLSITNNSVSTRLVKVGFSDPILNSYGIKVMNNYTKGTSRFNNTTNSFEYWNGISWVKMAEETSDIDEAMLLLNNGATSTNYDGTLDGNTWGVIHVFENPLPTGTKFINNGEIPVRLRTVGYIESQQHIIQIGETYTSEYNIVDITGAGKLGNYSVQVTRYDNLENLLKDVASKDSVNGIYTKSEIDNMLSNVVSPFRETSEDGFFLTDSAGNIALKYDSNGLDFAMLSEHAKQLIKSANELSYNVVDE